MVVVVNTPATVSALRAATAVPHLNPVATLLFVINSGSDTLDIDTKRAVIESALEASGRNGELLICGPGELPQVAR